MTCWPCSSARILRTLASGPGLLALEARGERPQADELQERVLDVEPGQALPRDGIGDRAGGPHRLEEVERGRARTPHSTPPHDNDTRSLPSVTLASRQPSFTSPTRLAAGMRTSVKNTSLKLGTPVIVRMGRISMPAGPSGR